MRGLRQILVPFIGLIVLASGAAWAVGDAADASVGAQLASHEVGLVDTTTGQWFLRDSLGRTVSFYYGVGGDRPLVGDWDCDGIDTPGMYRASDGLIYLRNSNTTGVADLSFHLGIPGDVPIAGDWDGDGCDTVGIFRDGHVYLTKTLGEEGGWLVAEFDFWFGSPGDVPFVGDFDGDGIDEIGLHRLASGYVYLRLTHTTGFADTEFFYGIAGDRLLVGDWTGNATETVGLYRRADSMFYLKYSNELGFADEEFHFLGGNGRNIPIAGHFRLSVDDVIALPVAGEMSEMWTEMFVIPYGDSPEMLGTYPGGDFGGVSQFGPEFGTQTPDGTWWILDIAKKRIAHYSQSGGFLDAVELGPELLSGGQFFTYQGSHGLADGTFVTTSVELGVGTHVLRILNGEADLATASGAMFSSTSDGERVYGFGLSGGRLALDPSIPDIYQTDWYYTQTGTRYFVSVDLTGLRIELPDAVPPVDRVVPIVTASDPQQSAFAIIEVATTADGNIHVLLYGFPLNEQTIQLTGFTTILPDGSLTPVETVQNPFSDVDPGSPFHLGSQFGADQPWMMFVDNDGLRVFQRTTVAGALYPLPADLESLLMSDEPPPQGHEVVASFARDILEIGQPVVTAIGGGDWVHYLVEGDGLVANIYTRIVAWRPDGTVIRGVASASTFDADDDWYLSASIREVDGAWTAQFGFPPLGDSAEVTYASGAWEVSEVTSTGEVTLQLPGAPIETPRLTIAYREGQGVIGFHGMVLPIGEFAAG